MIQKSSLPENLRSVSRLLTPDSSSFPAPLLVIRGSPPSIRPGQRKRRGRSNSSSTRQTVSVLPIRPSPLREGSHPLPAVPSRLLGAKSHKTSNFRSRCIVSSGGEIVCAFLRCEAAQGVGDGLPEVWNSSRGCGSQQGFEFCEGHFDGIEVGTVGREIFEACPGSSRWLAAPRRACGPADCP